MKEVLEWRFIQTNHELLVRLNPRATKEEAFSSFIENFKIYEQRWKVLINAEFSSCHGIDS